MNKDVEVAKCKTILEACEIGTELIDAGIQYTMVKKKKFRIFVDAAAARLADRAIGQYYVSKDTYDGSNN